MTPVVLINPNTNDATTARMVAIASSVAPPDVTIRGMTASFGAPLITTESELAIASEAVQALIAEIADDRMKSIRECVYSKEIYMPTLTRTRGAPCPLSELTSRLKCPSRGSRKVTVIFDAPNPILSFGRRQRIRGGGVDPLRPFLCIEVVSPIAPCGQLRITDDFPVPDMPVINTRFMHFPL